MLTVTAASVIAAVVAFFTPSAAGFKLPVHHAILEAGLPPLNAEVMADIVGHVYTGSGNFGSDLFQFSDFRHFDNAPDPATVCEEANFAWERFTFAIASWMVLGWPDKARSAFGALTHAYQDFYSHSNWLELGRRSLAPIVPVCAGLGLPADLQTGYFRIALSEPLSGCPHDSSGKPAPPPPFRYCHETLNKDDHVGHGGDPLPEGGKTYHQAATELAIAETQQVYQLVRNWLATNVTAEKNNLSGACLADILFGTSSQRISNGIRPQMCVDLTGRWRKLSSTPPNVGGALWTFTQGTQTDITGFVQTLSCGAIPLTAHRASPEDILWVGSVTSCPLEDPGLCPSTIQLPLKMTFQLGAWIFVTLTAIEVDEVGGACRTVGSTDQFLTLER